MTGRIPQQFIDDLVSRLDIVDLVDQYVPLRKAGREYIACCPFHQEKSASFTVSRDKQFYHCFGCGAHGTVIGFLMEHQNLGFVEAIEDLASRAGLEVPRGITRSPESLTAAKGVFDVLSQASHAYRAALRDESGAEAVEYLKARGVSGETAARFALGYAPSGWDYLLRKLGGSRQQEHLLQDAGLAIKKDGGGCYDRFRHRVMFPIRDQRGRVIAFGGRVMGDEMPKYMNSPETPVFHKGRELYGLYEARSSQRRLERLLVVEGYMDVIMLAQYDIGYAVATLGTATTKEHLEKLFRVVSEVVFCFDGDRAGREAGWRALENALSVVGDGQQVRFMFLPDGDDPDSLVQREGKAAFEVLIEAATPLSSYFFDELTHRADLSSLDGRARLVGLAKPLLAKLQQGVFKHMMVEQLARYTGLAVADLPGLLGAGAPQSDDNAGESGFDSGLRAMTSARPPAGRRGQNQSGKRPSLMRQVISMLLRVPALAGQVEDLSELRQVDVQGMSLLVELLELLHASPHLRTAQLLERWRDREEGRYLSQMVGGESLIENEGLEAEFSGALQRLLRYSIEQRIALLSERPAWSQQEKDEMRRLNQMLTN